MPRTHFQKTTPDRIRAKIRKSRRLKPVFTGIGQSQPAESMPAGRSVPEKREEKSQPKEAHTYRTLDVPKAEKPVTHMSGFSIKQMSDLCLEPTGQTQTAASQPEGEVDTNSIKDITPNELIVAWRTFAQSMPHEEKAMSERLDEIRPRMISKTEFEVIAENPTVRDAIKTLSHRIEMFMRQNLSHSCLTMKVVMRELSDRPIILSKPEQIKKMKEYNHAFAFLEKELGLTL